jgi:hypothetical protein
MNRNDIARLLIEAMRVTNHRDYVIIGSLSILGAMNHPPPSMTHSIDIDLYPKNDPARASGQGKRGLHDICRVHQCDGSKSNRNILSYK